MCLEYAQLQQDAASKSLPEKKVRVKAGLQKELVAEAKNMFEIEGDFDVPKQTINNRIKAEKLEVFHTGVGSPTLHIETFLVALIISAWRVKFPLLPSECILLMNKLIEDTELEAETIVWKMKQKCYDRNAELLLGLGWWRGFRRRNIGIVNSKVGQNISRQRASHCTYQAF